MASKNIVIVDPEKIKWERAEHLPQGAWTKMLRGDKETGTMILLFKADKDFHYPKHRHSSDESGVVLEGEVIDDKGAEIKRGMYYYITAGVEHGPFSTHEGYTLLIHFSGPKS